MPAIRSFASMKVAGFTFIRNALLYDYPVVEAITSILPVCDYFVVAVGKSDDATLDLVRGIGDPKIHIIETVWDDSLREGGRVLAVETDKAFDAIPPEYDWCFYIQADECVHENDLPAIRAAMERYLDDPQTQGLLFHYRHFYGSYDYVGASRRWYRREVRIIRNDKSIRSWKDAQGFRSPPLTPPGGGGTTVDSANQAVAIVDVKEHSTHSPLGGGGTTVDSANQAVAIVDVKEHSTDSPPTGGGQGGAVGARFKPLQTRLIPAHIHHYGWVKHPAKQQRKQQTFNRLWHSDEAVKIMAGEQEQYDYDGSEPLERFSGTHPAVMQPRIEAMNWNFSGDPTQARWSLKDRLSRWLEKNTGWRPGEYRNYILLPDQ